MPSVTTKHLFFGPENFFKDKSIDAVRKATRRSIYEEIWAKLTVKILREIPNVIFMTLNETMSDNSEAAKRRLEGKENNTVK